MAVRAMPLFRRACLSLLLAVPLLPNCMPDFDALSSGIVPVSGTGPTGDGGDASGGSGGASVGSSGASDGATGGTSVGGIAGASAAGGAAPDEAAGTGGALDAGGAGGEPSPSAGSGGDAGCGPAVAGVTVYNGFDDGLEGPGFANGAINADVHTALKATSSALWDSQEGSRCAGSLRLSCAFKAYASGTADDEKAFVNYFFDRRDWSGATALHAMVRVSPTAPPIAGVRLFVLSGDNYLYNSVLDDAAFKSGGWNPMTLPLQASTYYDPTNVYRIGVEVALLRADAPGIPSTPPVVDVWVDDVWLESK